MISTAKWFSSTSIWGFCRTASISPRWISKPVSSAWCRMRNSECPPSRCRSNCPSSFLSKLTPQLTNSSIPLGALRTTCSTAAGSLSQSPATIVSWICFSKSSTIRLVTEAIPPCAFAVLASSSVVLQHKAILYLPVRATLSAKLIPATPPPIIKKSNFLVISSRFA